MAKTTAVAMAILCVILCGSVKADYDETQVIHVGGKVLCQDCSLSWNDWVKGGKPIKGSKVSLTCLDARKRVSYYGSDETDEEGKYEISVKKVVYGREIDARRCLVRLVSSGDGSCNVATNFAGGKTGVWLKQPNVQFRGMVKYLLNPFFYTNPLCVDPGADLDNAHNGNIY